MYFSKNIIVSAGCILLFLLRGSVADPASERLFEDLMMFYTNLSRPVAKVSDVLTVNLKLKLIQIYDVHEKTQVMSTSMWLHQEWLDVSLKWDPNDYEGVTTLHVPSEMLWKPDLVLYNSCVMKFGTWTYDGSQIDLIHWTDEDDAPELTTQGGVKIWHLDRHQAVDLSHYRHSVEWDLIDITGDKRWALYPCCPAPFVDITVQIHLRRKTLFYSVNLVGPCAGLSFLSALTFQLPSDSHGKMEISVSILVSTVVFFLLLVEIIPPNSLVISLMARYLLFTMFLVCLSTIMTVVSVNHHFRIPSTHKMSTWARVWIIRKLAPILGLKSIKAQAPSGLRDAVIVMVENHLRKDSIAAKQILETHTIHEKWERRASIHPLLIQRMQSKKELKTNSSLAVYKYLATSIALIAHKIKRQRQEEDLCEDWKHVARVIDRVLLILFLLVVLVGGSVVLLQAPTLTDFRKPLV